MPDVDEALEGDSIKESEDDEELVVDGPITVEDATEEDIVVPAARKTFGFADLAGAPE
jgi:hypothetical protein